MSTRVPQPHSSAEQLAELERLLELCEVQAVRSGVPLAPRRPSARGRRQLRHLQPARDRRPPRPLRPRRGCRAGPQHHPRRGAEQDRRHLARVARGDSARPALRVSRRRTVRAARRASLQPEQARGGSLRHGDRAASGPRFSRRRSATIRRRRRRTCRSPRSTTRRRRRSASSPTRTSTGRAISRSALPWTSTVIYELHVRGYTIDPSAGVRFPGTYRGLIEKIPYLKDLGVTAVELMPVQEFNEHDLFAGRSDDRRAPEELLGLRSDRLLRAQGLVRERPRGRRAGPGVQGDGPGVPPRGARSDPRRRLQPHRRRRRAGTDASRFRGIDNAIYYWLADDKRYYRDFTGTGQTVNASHPVVRDLILDALRYWVMEMHVDGFRFDLASVLGRDVHGRVLADAPLLERIAEDPILRDAKLIAEAWDAAGAYQVGAFSQRRWAEWNGRFRDDVRRFWRGDAGMMGALRQPDLRQLRSLRRIRQGAGVQHQLRHLPRRLHPERPGQLRAQTQRGQRRGQSRRRRRELQRELRRRGRIRRPGRRGGPPAADQELPADPRHLPGRADAARRATSSAAPSGATTTPTARTTRRAGSTGRSASGMTRSFDSPATCSRFAGRTRCCVGKPSTPTRTSSGSIRTAAARTGPIPFAKAWRA